MQPGHPHLASTNAVDASIHAVLPVSISMELPLASRPAYDMNGPARIRQTGEARYSRVGLCINRAPCETQASPLNTRWS